MTFLGTVFILTTLKNGVNVSTAVTPGIDEVCC